MCFRRFVESADFVGRVLMRNAVLLPCTHILDTMDHLFCAVRVVSVANISAKHFAMITISTSCAEDIVMIGWHTSPRSTILIGGMFGNANPS